jgi:hypothetical protein
MADQGHFKVVNHTAPIGGQGCHESPFHQVNQYRGEPNLDNMTPESPDNGPTSLFGLADLVDQQAQLIGG